MIVHIRCVRCGHKFSENDSVLGRSVPCSGCGQWLKVEAGPVLAGEATFARVSAADPPKPAPKQVPRTVTDDELPVWRRPAVIVSAMGFAALGIVFLVMALSRGPARPIRSPGPPVPPEGTGAKPPPSPPVPQTPPTKAVLPSPALPTSSTPASPTIPPASRADLSPEVLFKTASPAVVRIVVRDENLKQIGLGSGFFVSADGVLVTNHHVVAKARFATVVLPTEATLFVDGILAQDEGADLAVLKVNGRQLPHLAVAADGQGLAVGARVYAIGNPGGLTNTLSEGIVSGMRTVAPNVDFIQMTAAISPGSSGGPVMNMKGQVVGVATMSLGGQDAQNLNFAVPAGTVQGILAKAAQAKPVPLASAGGRPLEQDGAREFLAAMQAIDEERWSDAVRIVQGLRQSEPSNPLVFFILGVLHFELGNQDLALETFREGVRLAPEEPITHVGLGVVLQRMGRHADSVASFRAAIRLSPDYWPAYQGLGVSQYHLGQYRESAATLRTAVRLEPEAENAWYFLGLDYVALRDHGAALSCYRALRYLDPGLAADLAKQIPGP